MKTLTTVLLATILTTALGASGLAAQGTPGVDWEPKLIHITGGVYAYEGPLPLPGYDEIVRTNSLVVVTDEGVVVVDGQDTVEDSEDMIEAIRAVTDQPIRFLVNASPHGDHVNGNDAFAGSIIIAHEGAYEAMAEAAENARANGGPQPTMPHQTISDEATIRLGGTEIQLYFFGRGHTRGDLVTYLPEERVAFMSELYFNRIAASVGEGFAAEHLVTLDRAMELPAEWWIPGHGYIDGVSKEDLRSGLDLYRDNVAAIYSAVSLRVARGQSLEEVLAGIDDDLGDFAKLPFYGFLKNSAIGGTYRAVSASR